MTELVFILDRSGSMAGLEADTIGGFNAMIEKQKREPGQALVSTVLFSNGSPGAGIGSAYPHMNRRLSDVRRLSPGLPPAPEIFCLTECSASKTCRPGTAHRS